jgi:hypothetical protein
MLTLDSTCSDLFYCNCRDIQASSVLLDDKFEVRLGSMSDICAQQSGGSQKVFSWILRSSKYDYLVVLVFLIIKLINNLMSLQLYRA